MPEKPQHHGTDNARTRFSPRWSIQFVRVLVSAALLVVSGCGSMALDDLIDSDRDGLTDALERRLGLDPSNADTDADGLSDGDEIAMGTSPLDADSDHDGIVDSIDAEIASPLRGVSVSSGNDVEPNDSFTAGVKVGNLNHGPRLFAGRIDQQSDIDVFNLGVLELGQRITIDLIASGSLLRPTIALFDAGGRVVDIRAYPFVETGLDAPGVIDQPIRRAAQQHQLVVTQGAGETDLGAYALQVTITPVEAIPVPVPQAVLLDFRGGTLDPPILGAATIDPFTAGAIAQQYAGQDDLLRRGIVEAIAADFAGLDVLVFTSDEPVPPGVETLTTIYFGSTNDAVLGAARAIDPYNEDRCDDGVIFTASFNPETFGFAPELDRLALAIGQAASHEIGHLLGLRHVNADTALMNEDPSTSALFLDLQFIDAPLGDATFPIGRQDAHALLQETVGVK